MSILKRSAAALCLIAPLLSQAATVKPLKIKVVTEILPPYQVQMDDGSLGGFSTEVVKALFQLSGDKADIQVMPWPRAYTTALGGTNVMIYSLSYSKQRQQRFHWIGTLQKERGYIWGLKSNFSEPFSNIDQARQYWITSTHNSNPDMYLRQHNFIKINRVSSPEQNVAMLFRGRTQLVIGAETPFRYIAAQRGYDFNLVRKLIAVPALSTELKLAFGPNTDKALVERYRRLFEQLKKSDRLEQLRQSWQLTK